MAMTMTMIATGSSPPPRTAQKVIVLFASAAWAVFFLSIHTAQRAASPTRRVEGGEHLIQRQLREQPPSNRTLADDRSRRSLFAGIHLERTEYKLPGALDRTLIDVDNVPADGTEFLPVFWHVLKSGGTTVKLMYAQCYGLVEACETGEAIDRQSNNGEQQHPGQSSLESMEREMSPWEWIQQQQQQQAQQMVHPNQRRRLETMPFTPMDASQLRVVISEDGRKYVNVDTTTQEGIAKASQLGFASSNLADVMFTPLLVESAESLLHENSGRMFAIFRHPVERVISIFYYLQGATWEPTYNPEYAQWTIDDYALSPYCESNWMVRSLTNKMTGPLSSDDISIAKEVLRRKCLIGLMEGMEESVQRFHSYFGFGDDKALQCSRDHFSRKGSGANSHSHPVVDQASEIWAVLARKNELDIQLYEYAQQLFKEQGEWLVKKNMI